MAVQQNKVTRARRGKRRSHDALGNPTTSVDPMTGETHRRHQRHQGWFLSRPEGRRGRGVDDRPEWPHPLTSAGVRRTTGSPDRRTG